MDTSKGIKFWKLFKKYIKLSVAKNYENYLSTFLGIMLPHILLCEESTKIVQSPWMANDQIMSYDVV